MGKKREINCILNDISKKLNEECFRISSKFKDVQNYYGLDYLRINQCAKELLDTIWGEVGYDIPVDIFRLVEELGIEIISIRLNEEDKEKVNRTVGRMSVRPNFVTSGKNRCIYIDSESSLFTQRFVVAHELAHLIMDLENEDWWTSVEDCVMPMLPLKISELVADSFAIFLLIPMEPFLNVFKRYVDKEGKAGNWPIVTEDWLRYLSLKVQISYYYVAYAYEQLRYVAYWMYVNRENYPVITDEIVDMLFQ